MDPVEIDKAWTLWEEAAADPPPQGDRRRVDHGAAISEAYFSMDLVRYALRLPAGRRLFLADPAVAAHLDDLRQRYNLETEVRAEPDTEGNGDLILSQDGTYVCRLQPDRFFAVPERSGKGLLGELMALYVDNAR